MEIGKAELLTAEQFKVINPAMTYHPIALDDLLLRQPEWFPGEFDRVNRGYEEKRHRALPITRYRIERAEEAFRFLSRGKNVGKVVLEMGGEDSLSLKRRKLHH